MIRGADVLLYVRTKDGEDEFHAPVWRETPVMVRNVLIGDITAERIKEEVRAGRTIDGAIQIGSKNSFWAIFDGNITVIIVAVVLMGVFGPPDGFWGTILKPVLMWFPAATTGSIYSFGYTLFVGIIFNFVMGVTASRLMLKSISRFKFLRKPWLLGGKRA